MFFEYKEMGLLSLLQVEEVSELGSTDLYINVLFQTNVLHACVCVCVC